MQPRHGLTRIEFLVGLLTATLVIGCFLAAMFRLRTEADMMKCSNNLKQLGLALHNYHDTNDSLPLLVDKGEGAPTGLDLFSAFASLTPYVEATWFLSLRGKSRPEFYHAHSSVPFTFHDIKTQRMATQNGGDANHVWNTFICPSDSSADKLRDVPRTLPDGSTGYYATSSYAANGLLPWGVKRPRDSLPGGLSNTILFGERPQVCVNADGETIYNLWGVGFYSPHMPTFATLTPTEPPGLWSTNQFAPVLPLPDAEGPVPIRMGRQDAPIDVNGVSTPIQRVRSGRPCDPRLPGTPHSRGMQVAMCDGSVRVFTTQTSAWVFWSACIAGDKNSE